VAWGDHHRRLAAHPLLQGLRRSVIRRWALAADEVEFDPGEVLLREDRLGYWFFLVQDGEAELTRAGEKVGEVGAGGHLGELSILGCGPQPATAVAKTRVRAFVLGRRALLGLIYDLPPVQRRLLPDMGEDGYAARVRELRAAATEEWRRVARSWPQQASHSVPVFLNVVRPGRPVPSAGRPFSILGPGLATLRPSRQGDVDARRPMPWPVRVGVAATVALAAGIAGLAYHPPMIVVDRLGPIDISHDVVVRGAPVHPVHGRYLLLPVRLDRPTAWAALWAVVSHRPRFPLHGAPRSAAELAEARRQDEELFRQSQQEAAVAAARADGIDVRAGGDGARVVEVADAARVLGLQQDDVIVAVSGAAVRLSSDVSRLIAQRPGGAGTVLSVERDGKAVLVPVPPRSLPGGRLPVVLATRHATFSLPFEVSFRRRPIGGPSGGLVYSLLLADMLGRRDLGQGRTITATGAVDASGVVSAVGFVAEKGEAAAGAHATDFLVPASQAGAVRAPHLRLRGVLTVDDALQALARY
jgi:PDZ domain-containing secreted protein